MKILAISLSRLFFLLLLPPFLQSSPPISIATTDVKALARTALQMGLAKANKTLGEVGELFKKNTDPLLYRYYGTCIEEYEGAVTRHIPEAIAALEVNDYGKCKEEAGFAAINAQNCEDQFTVRESPLTVGNRVVRGLSLVAWNIVDILG